MRRRLSLVLAIFSAGLLADDGSGLHIGANGDIVGQFSTSDSTTARDRLEVREAEVNVYAPIDHLFDAQLSLAAHQEGDGAVFEVHEVYLGSSKLIPRSRFRVGQFFLGVGRLNQIHRHDWPFVSAPKVHRQFFAEEAAIDGGAEYSWLTPLPFFLDITVGVTNGYVFGHAHNQGDKPLIPTHYVRAVTFQGFGATGGWQLGLNYLGRKNVDHVTTSLLGVDSIFKWKNDEGHSSMVQGELWYRVQTPEGSDSTKNFGFYLFPNIALTANFWAGLRFDYYSAIGLTNVLGDPVSDFEYAFVPTLTYRTSEFATFRLAFNWGSHRLAGTTVDDVRLVEGQAIFILGAHPAHEF